MNLQFHDAYNLLLDISSLGVGARPFSRNLGSLIHILNIFFKVGR